MESTWKDCLHTPLAVCGKGTHYLAGDLDALPQTEVDEDPGTEQDQQQLPANRPLVVDAIGLFQHATSKEKKHSKGLIHKILAYIDTVEINIFVDIFVLLKFCAPSPRCQFREGKFSCTWQLFYLSYYDLFFHSHHIFAHVIPCAKWAHICTA